MSSAGRRKQLLRATDLAADLDVTTGRVYQLIREGVIPATRLNRTVVIPRAAWEEWLRRRGDDALASIATARGPRADDAPAA